MVYFCFFWWVPYFLLSVRCFWSLFALGSRVISAVEKEEGEQNSSKAELITSGKQRDNSTCYEMNIKKSFAQKCSISTLECFFLFSSNPHSFACSPSYLLWSISNEEEEEEKEEWERNRFHLTPRTSCGKTEEVGGRGKKPCPFLEQEDRAFQSFFVALVVIIRFDLGHPSGIVQLWIWLTLVTRTLLEFLAPITHPRLSGEMQLKSVPYEKEPQPTSINFTIQTGTGNPSMEKYSARSIEGEKRALQGPRWFQ